MHITVSVVVIMFELTGALDYILPTMIVVGVTKAVTELFGKGGIADRMIWFNGFPFLDNKEQHTFGIPVSQVMTSEVVFLPTTGLRMKDVEKLLKTDKYQGFPIVEDSATKVLAGYIGRTELRYAVDRIKKDRAVSPDAKCYFTPPASMSAITPSVATPGFTFESTVSDSAVDFSRFIDPTPVTVHPRLPLETVMELFRKIGPRVILIEYCGKLIGLVTVKDCLKYQFKVEASENPRDDTGIVESQERLWGVLKKGALWISDKVLHVSRGRIHLGGDQTGRPPPGLTPSEQMMDGTEDIDDGVELEDRS
jgi:chloride channel 3/4/5